MLNRVILMGRLTADPELKKTNSDISVTSFSLAVDRNYGKGADRQTDFINCGCMASDCGIYQQIFFQRQTDGRRGFPAGAQLCGTATRTSGRLWRSWLTRCTLPTAKTPLPLPLPPLRTILVRRPPARSSYAGGHASDSYSAPSFHRVQLWLFQRRCGGL